jgi:hypothetical protein
MHSCHAPYGCHTCERRLLGAECHLTCLTGGQGSEGDARPLNRDQAMRVYRSAIDIAHSAQCQADVLSDGRQQNSSIKHCSSR